MNYNEWVEREVKAIMKTLKYFDNKGFPVDEKQNKYRVRKFGVRKIAMQHAKNDGLVLEFGSYRGSSSKHLALYTDKTVYGFDSFEGLPNDWNLDTGKKVLKAGHFTLEGNIPKPKRKNIKFIKGWFDETLPPFLEKHKENISVLHVDCDIYESTKIVLDLIKDRLVPGTVIIWDEIIGNMINEPNRPKYENYPEGEMKCWYELCQEKGWELNKDYKYICTNGIYQAAAIML